MEKKITIISIQIFFLVGIIHCQSEIGIIGGIHFETHFVVETYENPSLSMTPKLSNGYNFNLIYQRFLKEGLKVRGQFSFSGFQKEFKMHRGARFFSSSREGQLEVKEISVGIILLKKINSNPKFQIGIGVNGIKEIGDPSIDTIIRTHNFQSSTSLTREETINQSELIKEYGLGLILRGEVNIPIKSNLNLIGGINLNQRITNFAKKEISASNVFLTRLNIEIGLIKLIK